MNIFGLLVSRHNSFTWIYTDGLKGHKCSTFYANVESLLEAITLIYIFPRSKQ